MSKKGIGLIKKYGSKKVMRSNSKEILERRSMNKSLKKYMNTNKKNMNKIQDFTNKNRINPDYANDAYTMQTSGYVEEGMRKNIRDRERRLLINSSRYTNPENQFKSNYNQKERVALNAASRENTKTAHNWYNEISGKTLERQKSSINLYTKTCNELSYIYDLNNRLILLSKDYIEDTKKEILKEIEKDLNDFSLRTKNSEDLKNITNSYKSYIMQIEQALNNNDFFGLADVNTKLMENETFLKRTLQSVVSGSIQALGTGGEQIKLQHRFNNNHYGSLSKSFQKHNDLFGGAARILTAMSIDQRNVFHGLPNHEEDRKFVEISQPMVKYGYMDKGRFRIIPGLSNLWENKDMLIYRGSGFVNKYATITDVQASILARTINMGIGGNIVFFDNKSLITSHFKGSWDTSALLVDLKDPFIDKKIKLASNFRDQRNYENSLLSKNIFKLSCVEKENLLQEGSLLDNVTLSGYEYIQVTSLYNMLEAIEYDTSVYEGIKRVRLLTGIPEYDERVAITELRVNGILESGQADEQLFRCRALMETGNEYDIEKFRREYGSVTDTGYNKFCFGLGSDTPLKLSDSIKEQYQTEEVLKNKVLNEDNRLLRDPNPLNYNSIDQKNIEFFYQNEVKLFNEYVTSTSEKAKTNLYQRFGRSRIIQRLDNYLGRDDLVKLTESSPIEISSVRRGEDNLKKPQIVETNDGTTIDIE